MEDSEWDDDDRRNRLNISTINRKLQKKAKKERRKALVRFALDGVIHQIKMVILVVAIIALIVLLLCSAAWYVLDQNESKEKAIIPGAFLQINDNNV